MQRKLPTTRRINAAACAFSISAEGGKPCTFDKEIADKLGVTEGTIKIHLHAIYEKLGARSTFELMIALADRRRGKA